MADAKKKKKKKKSLGTLLTLYVIASLHDLLYIKLDGSLDHCWVKTCSLDCWVVPR